MGKSVTAKLAFAIQISYQSFVDQINIENINKIEELFMEDLIQLHDTLPKQYRFPPSLDTNKIYDMFKETTCETKKLKKLKKILNNFEEKNDILIFCKDTFLSCDNWGDGDAYETITFEDFETEKRSFERICNNYGLVYDVKLVVTLISHYF
jgi:hypothetical protein